MFGGKREKALEEELKAVRGKAELQNTVLEEIRRERENTTEQFAAMTAAQAQMEKQITAMEEQVRGVEELAGQGARTADEVYHTLIEGKNASESFRANHTIFVDGIKEQNGQIGKLAENSRDLAEQMDQAVSLPEQLAAGCGQMEEEVGHMLEFSRNMSVLSLNAAIEAGRMGEVGSRFIGAAEEVRSFADQYVRSAEQVEQQLAAFTATVRELSELVTQLSGRVQDNRSLVADIQKNSIRTMATYETGQVDIRELIPEETAGRVDALQQSQKEILRCKEELAAQLKQFGEELAEQKLCRDEVEQSVTRMGRETENAQRNKGE
ncbi:MAG: methyl-accepting chemotaxis protein [Roseburia sp.]